MDLSLVIPTHNRPEVLAHTLDRLAKLDRGTIGDSCELIIVDNGSDRAPEPPRALENGIEVRVILLGENISAAARNIGGREARAEWVVMLDDDSSLEKCSAIETLRALPEEVHAVGGEIFLPDGGHEAGGLPEVVIGCGCAYRTGVFSGLGGYDRSFDFYAEEYDLCARILLGGGRVVHSSGLRFEHRKSAENRSFGRIIHRLVRNNGWVIKRYTPEAVFRQTLDQMIARYEHIARKEGVLAEYKAGLDELERTIDQQPCRRMSGDVYSRFIGEHACVAFLRRELDGNSSPLRLVASGKGSEIIESTIARLGQRCEAGPDARPIIGTLSPGPMRDAQRKYPDAVSPWMGFV